MVKAKRIAQLEAALEEAQRAPHRQAAPFRGDPQKRALAPKRPHHRRMTFQDELRALLNKHGIRFDERYLWD
jgi:hypothetical protein